MDRLLRIIDDKSIMRIFAADTKELVDNARRTHNLSPVASAALGRTLTASLMMGMMFKNDDDKLTIQIKGDGPLGGVVTVSNYKGKVKGYAYNPDVYLRPTEQGKLDVGGAVGKGYLNVIKDIGLKEPYIGFVPLVSGEIGEDFAYYFFKSEQVPSIVVLGVLVEKSGEIGNAGGLIIQLLPEAGEEVIKNLEENLKGFESITSYLSKGESIEDIVKRIVGDIGLKITQEIKPEYLCDCSKARMEEALASLGRKELSEIIETQGQVEIECHFCLRKYTFQKEELVSQLKYME